MRRAAVVGLVTAIIGLPPTRLSAQTLVPVDFAVRFEFGVCTTDVLDTFKNVFLRDMGWTNPAVSAPLVLPPDVRQAIYEEVVKARFFEYPTRFSFAGDMWVMPADHYRLEVRSAGVSHTVVWLDDVGPRTEEADRLRALFTTIRQLLDGLPEVKRLPTPRLHCI
jgi:hypothetical protein